MSTPAGPSDMREVRSLVFDLMGTCVDWFTSIVSALEALQSSSTLESAIVAHQWRRGFFDSIQRSFERGEQSPDIDVVHRQVLDEILAQNGAPNMSDAERTKLVQAWHSQRPWPDSRDGLERLREQFDVVVLANGSTRLQLDIASSAGLPFHALFSSQLLNLTKPDPRIYERCLSLLDRQPNQVAMVAAHAYDLRAAAKVGMRTIYIHRATEDLTENMERLRSEFDLFIDEGGLMTLADTICAEHA